MGTLIEITVQGVNKDIANIAINKSFNEISRLENIMSTYLPNSELSKLNISAGTKKKIPVSFDLKKVIQRGIHWGKLSNGAVDISIGPAIKLWNFNLGKPTPPEPKKLKKASSLVNYKNIHIKNNLIELKKNGMSLNLGSIGKGYAVDRAVEILKSSGVTNGLVNAGGDLLAFGTRDGIKPWSIGLQHPRKPSEIIASLDLTDKAVATSGDYQRYFFHNKKRYHHILKPADGWPSEKAISATVVTNKVIDADALSTALFILGEKQGIDLINSLENVEGMIFSSIGSVSFSSGFHSLPGLSFYGLKNDLSY